MPIFGTRGARGPTRSGSSSSSMGGGSPASPPSGSGGFWSGLGSSLGSAGSGVSSFLSSPLGKAASSRVLNRIATPTQMPGAPPVFIPPAPAGGGFNINIQQAPQRQRAPAQRRLRRPRMARGPQRNLQIARQRLRQRRLQAIRQGPPGGFA